MKFTIFQESRVGRRRTNQDRVAYCYSREALLMILADGMGGHLHGEVAAQIAVQFVTQSFQREAKPSLPDVVLFLSRALSSAHHAILDYAFDKNLPDAPRTTVVACIVQDSQAYWAHAGDSRLYLLRRGGVAAQTRDHSRVQMMMDQGLLDAEGAAKHPSRNRIYSCLGGSHSPQIEFSKRTPLHRGDVIAMCSDGVWGPIQTEVLTRGLAGPNLMQAVPRVMDVAEEKAGSSCDNLSLIAMHWDEDFADDAAETVSTQTMALGSFTTQMEGFARTRPQGTAGADELSDDEIERAIQEINSAIQKFSK
ncbi:MAG: serine/threonine-protein phosphatase [Zoogloeaceae bacterium]|nr:serine/threonine-protein phosphatase [Rhodocyclaceae bacterium]MCP5231906.1 serine/threonine-protein phosphatase [Zoogloeaceae bacterium]MCP5239461.1 serine/threonine-protein phosphatase [Zoogloeaceae bacterium]MCP5255502.1 serine/threonine-protein phosphatase [Zoogloeaceae bacterium]MCW5616456.1 serine/threonine-protein phosphatase [Rhodocyclaceae bacterium]